MHGLGERHELAGGADVVVQTRCQFLGRVGLDLALGLQGGQFQPRAFHTLILVVSGKQTFFTLQFAQRSLIGLSAKLFDVDGRAVGLGGAAFDQLFQALDFACSEALFELVGFEPDGGDVRLAVELDLGLKHFAPGDGGQCCGHGRGSFGQNRFAVEN